MTMLSRKVVSTEYSHAENVLHLWVTEPVNLRDQASVAQFFEEVRRDHIDKTPSERFWLLVNYENLRINPEAVDAYARNIAHFRERVLGTFRYNVIAGFTGVAVSLGNSKLQSAANIFASEREARDAIRAARQSELPEVRTFPRRCLASQYETVDNILHVGAITAVQLGDDDSVIRFTDELIRDHIDKVPAPLFWLLINYENIRVHPSATDALAQNIARYQSRLLGIFRYNVVAGFSGVALRLGSLKLQVATHIYESEQQARAAIRAAKESALKPQA